MANNPNGQKAMPGKSSPMVGQTHYVFKSPAEMPRIKPDYVVQSPTPRGQRTEDTTEKRK